MPIKVNCDQCQKVLNAPDQMAGRRAKCPGCGAAVLIPAAAGEATKPAPAKPAAAKPTADKPTAAKPAPAKSATPGNKQAAAKSAAGSLEDEFELDSGGGFLAAASPSMSSLLWRPPARVLCRGMIHWLGRLPDQAPARRVARFMVRGRLPQQFRPGCGWPAAERPWCCCSSPRSWCLHSPAAMTMRSSRRLRRMPRPAARRALGLLVRGLPVSRHPRLCPVCRRLRPPPRLRPSSRQPIPPHPPRPRRAARPLYPLVPRVRARQPRPQALKEQRLMSWIG